MRSREQKGAFGKRARKWLSVIAALFVIAALAAPIFFTFLVNKGAERSFLIEAKTSEIQLTFGNGSSDWRLPNAALCLPSPPPSKQLLENCADPNNCVPAVTSSALSNEVCGLGFASDGAAGERIMHWSRDENVKIQIKPDGTLIIWSIGESSQIPAGAFMSVAPDIWDANGTLLFAAKTTVGSDIASGTRYYLWSGEWEAREASEATFLFRSETEVVKSGTLSAGARVSVTSGQEDIISYGHIARRDEGGPMDVTLLSEFDDSALSVRYYGVPVAVRIQPDWVDVATKSPLLLAIAALIPLLASIGLFLSDIVRRSDRSTSQAVEESVDPRWYIRRLVNRSMRRHSLRGRSSVNRSRR